jgi:hypothetical protein
LDRIKDIRKLCNILDYLGVPYESKNSRERLILLIMEKQVEMQPYLGDPVPETPKYSVRVRRIMEAKAKGEML